jgi:hypothetical protein
MRKSEILAFVATTIVLAGCSSGSSGGGNNRGFSASDQISGRLTPDIQSIQHQPEAERQLEAWRNECGDADGYKIPNLRAGMHFQTREDNISLWPDLKPEGDARVLEQTVESVVSAKEFFSIQKQISQGYSVTMRSHHTAGVGHYGYEMVGIISTNPPGLKNQIEKGIGRKDDTHVRCHSSIPDNSQFKRDVAFATLTLQNGATVNGILVVERNEFTNYTCGLYRADNSLIREEMLSTRGVNESVTFYSKDIVSPFEAQCHDDPSLLSIRTDRDLSGGRGILSLNKTEVLGF